MTYQPNPIQLKHKIASAGYNYTYIVKPRQLGFTTDACIDLLDDALWTPGMSCAILAHERKTLGSIFEIVKRAYDNLPKELKPITRYDTKNEYKFMTRYDGRPLDSEIYVALTLRGTTVQRLHVSESAYIKDRDELKQGAKQAVPIGGTIAEESTGNGVNDFYDDVQNALEKMKLGTATKMDYRVFFYAWFENPEYILDGKMPEILPEDVYKYGKEQEIKEKFNLSDGQLLWRRWKIDEIRSKAESGIGLNAVQKFQQEYPATLNEAFQSGAGNIFESELVDALILPMPLTMLQIKDQLLFNFDIQEAQEKEDNQKALLAAQSLLTKGFNLWKLPKPDHHYLIGVDPSDGEGSDNTSINVWDKEDLEQVGQFYGKIRPDNGAEVCKEIAEFYNDAFAIVENNMLSFILFLSKIYDNYYTERRVDQKTQKITMTLGFNTNGKTRDPLIDEFIAMWEEGHLKINSAITAREMKTFVRKENGKREHADGRHDDSLIGDMLAVFGRKIEPRRGRAFATKAF